MCRRSRSTCCARRLRSPRSVPTTTTAHSLAPSPENRLSAVRLHGVTIPVGVLGARGRMGSEVCRAVESADDMTLAGAVDVGDDRDALRAADVVVDFTTPDVVMDNLAWCIEAGK